MHWISAKHQLNLFRHFREFSYWIFVVRSNFKPQLLASCFGTIQWKTDIRLVGRFKQFLLCKWPLLGEIVGKRWPTLTFFSCCRLTNSFFDSPGNLELTEHFDALSLDFSRLIEASSHCSLLSLEVFVYFAKCNAPLSYHATLDC